jgi:hypothetical protein
MVMCWGNRSDRPGGEMCRGGGGYTGKSEISGERCRGTSKIVSKCLEEWVKFSAEVFRIDRKRRGRGGGGG